MKKYLAISTIIACTAFSHAQAQTDIIGGSFGAQTMHHCGFLPAHEGNYTTNPLTARILQKKLQQLGYYRAAIDGKFGPQSRRAIRDFQFDSQLPETGRADGATVSRLAYAAHPSANVQRCFRAASNSYR